jgi:hypothetical protein
MVWVDTDAYVPVVRNLTFTGNGQTLNSIKDTEEKFKDVFEARPNPTERADFEIRVNRLQNTVFPIQKYRVSPIYFLLHSEENIRIRHGKMLKGTSDERCQGG